MFHNFNLKILSQAHGINPARTRNQLIREGTIANRKQQQAVQGQAASIRKPLVKESHVSVTQSTKHNRLTRQSPTTTENDTFCVSLNTTK